MPLIARELVVRFWSRIVAVVVPLTPALLGGCAVPSHVKASKAFDRAKPVVLSLESPPTVVSQGYLAPQDARLDRPKAPADVSPPPSAATRAVARPSAIWHKRSVYTAVTGRPKIEFPAPPPSRKPAPPKKKPSLDASTQKAGYAK